MLILRRVKDKFVDERIVARRTSIYSRHFDKQYIAEYSEHLVTRRPRRSTTLHWLPPHPCRGARAAEAPDQLGRGDGRYSQCRKHLCPFAKGRRDHHLNYRYTCARTQNIFCECELVSMELVALSELVAPISVLHGPEI